MAIRLIYPLLLPLAGGVFLPKRQKSRNLYLSVLLLLELLLTVWVSWGESGTLGLVTLTEGVSLSLRVDRLSFFFAGVSCLAFLLVGIFSFEYMEHEKAPLRFYRFYLFSLFAILGICFSANLPTLYMFYEMLTFISVLLVIHSQTHSAMAAGLKYLSYSVIGAAAALLGTFILFKYGAAEPFAIGGTLKAVPRDKLLIVYFLMVIGFGCKAGMLPLHAWLPTAHPVAPAPASAVLSGVITKMGAFAILRLSFFVYDYRLLAGSWAQKALIVLALCTIFMGSMLASKERLLKKRLAWSSVSQLSYVLFGILCLNELSLSGALLQVFFHSMAKCLLFCVAGAIIIKTGKTYADELSGLFEKMPALMAVFTLGSLSVVGIPPLGGFFSKWNLAIGALSSEIGYLAYAGPAVLMVSAVLTAYYLLSIVYLAAYEPESDLKVSSPLRLETLLPLYIMGLLLLVLGIFSSAFSNFIFGFIHEIF